MATDGERVRVCTMRSAVRLPRQLPLQRGMSVALPAEPAFAYMTDCRTRGPPNKQALNKSQGFFIAQLTRLNGMSIGPVRC